MKVRGPVNEPPDLKRECAVRLEREGTAPATVDQDGLEMVAVGIRVVLEDARAGTFRVTPVVAVYASSFATGAAFVTWIVTVTVFEGISPLSW